MAAICWAWYIMAEKPIKTLISLSNVSVLIPLTNQVRGLYCKLRTEFFLIDLFVLGPLIKGNKRGSVTYRTDRKKEVSEIFIISLRLIRCAEKETFMIFN